MKKMLMAVLLVTACGGGGDKKQETTPTPLPENTGGGMGGDAYGGDSYAYGGDMYGGGGQRMAPLCPPAPEETATLTPAEEMRRAENIVVALEQMAQVAQKTKDDCAAMEAQMKATIVSNCKAFAEAKAMKSDSPELEAKYKGRVESAVGQLMEPMMNCPRVGEMMGQAME